MSNNRITELLVLLIILRLGLRVVSNNRITEHGIRAIRMH